VVIIYTVGVLFGLIAVVGLIYLLYELPHH
jgi:hypothetical protein